MRTRLALLLGVCAAVMAVGASSALAHLPVRYTVRPVHLSPSQVVQQGLAGTTIRSWSGSIKSLADGNTYQYSIIGKNPKVKQTNATTTIDTDVVPIKLIIGGETFDPNAHNSTCHIAKGALYATLNSPLFQNHQYTLDGLDAGDTQYSDMFQRMEFAKYALGASPVNPTYHIYLKGHGKAAVTVTVPSNDGSVLYPSYLYGGCSDVAGMDINWWDPYLQSTIIPALQSAGVTTSVRDLIALTSNVVMYDSQPGNCCILGYHSGVSTGQGLQYYETADYDSSGLFTSDGSNDDISPLSHEIGEWLNDPSGNNATPAWGHIGQVSGCQNNFEVGDPLSGTTVRINMNGVTYHPQEMAFFGWFYRVATYTPNHWFSSNGTFRTNAGAVCS